MGEVYVVNQSGALEGNRRGFLTGSYLELEVGAERGDIMDLGVLRS